MVDYVATNGLIWQIGVFLSWHPCMTPSFEDFACIIPVHCRETVWISFSLFSNFCLYRSPRCFCFIKEADNNNGTWQILVLYIIIIWNSVFLLIIINRWHIKILVMFINMSRNAYFMYCIKEVDNYNGISKCFSNIH